MVARRGWLKFRRLPGRSVGLIDFALHKKKAGETGPRLISERVAFNCLSCQLLGLFELTKINHHSRQKIARRWIPWRELVRASEFVHALGKFPFDKKANPPERGVRFGKLWFDRDSFLAIARCFRPCFLLFITLQIADPSPRFRTLGISQRILRIETNCPIKKTDRLEILLKTASMELKVTLEICIVCFYIFGRPISPAAIARVQEC